MPLHLLYSDDFTGYASTAEFYAAYPYDPPGDLTSSVPPNPYDPTPYVAWGLTRGPAGGPGIQNVSAVETTDPFSHGPFPIPIDKVDLDPQCRLFRVVGSWDFATFDPTIPANAGSALFQVWSYESGNRLGSFDGYLTQVSRNHNTGEILFNITTTPGYGNVGTPAPGAWKQTYATSIASTLLESGGIYTIQIDGQPSELTETSPGIWAPSTDGFIRVSVNGTEIFSFDGPVWHGNRTTNRNWNSISFYSVGRFTDLQIYDEIGCDTTEPPPCECEPPPKTPPKYPPPIPPRPPKTPPIIGVQLACIGGGLVPTQADLVYVENWWGL